MIQPLKIISNIDYSIRDWLVTRNPHPDAVKLYDELKSVPEGAD